MRHLGAVLFLLVVSAVLDVCQAGRHAGGTLLVHTENLEYSVGDLSCDVEAPASCASVTTRVDGPGPTVWVVYAAFVDADTPRLRGIEFGVEHTGIEIVDHGSCADLELALPGWPASGSGTIIVWYDDQVGQLIPAYWFAGYAATLGAAASFQLDPHPQNGDHFGDGAIVPVVDEIVEYGSLGFGVEGTAPCPVVRDFTIRADGTGDVPTIADAIRIAAAGSVIELEDGIYRGEGNRDLQFNHTPLTLRSISGNPQACIIDCEGSPGDSHRGILIRWLEDTSSLVSGIKFVNGYVGSELAPNQEGGAIKIDQGGSLRLVNCVFENCTAVKPGGAIDAGGVRVEIESCVFTGNRTTGYGGGGFAGGGHIVIRDCLFEGNAALVEGGGVWVTNGTLEMENCRFIGNRAGFGGGMVSYGIEGTVTRTTWLNNQAAQSGGGLYCREGNLVVENSTFCDNRAPRGAAVALRTTGQTGLVLRRSILAFSDGESAVYCGSGKIEAWHCDFWGSTGEDWTECLTDPSGDRGNFSADPLFCDRASGDLSLHQDSPCVTRDGFSRDPIGAWPIGCGTRAGVNARNVPESSAHFELAPETPALQASPNPFRAETTVTLSLPESSPAAPVKVEIFDLGGRVVRSLEGSGATVGRVASRVGWTG